MQTFLPDQNYIECARVLDYKRLGKQRVECLQILKALLGLSKGWINHPATVMWRGYEGSLCDYAYHMCEEWVARGFKDTCQDKIRRLDNFMDRQTPAWVGNELLHKSHRVALLVKDYEWYKQFSWKEARVRPTTYSYVWPQANTATKTTTTK